jgi:4-hydroxybenzoyl-CoA reductase subunit beta
MLPLPKFQLHTPRTIAEALRDLELYLPEAKLVAGGTDLVPNMKHGLVAPRHLVSLANVRELSGITLDPDALHVGAMTSLDAIADDPDVRARATALAEAAASVGGPHHRRMGTLGGNLCLDTRCRYYNQTHFWRSALGYCLKKDGSVCHVVAGGRKCVAAASNDTAAAAIALDATVVVVGPGGARNIPAGEFWTADGIALLSVATRVDVADGRVTDLSVVASALAARPKRVSAAKGLAVGRAPADVPVDAVAEATFAECRPLPNVDPETEWRRQMARVLARRALGRALG